MRLNRITRLFGRKMRVGRFGFPVWTVGLAAMAMAAVAGQAVGPVLTGSITGSANLTVAQTVVLAAAPADMGAITDTYDGTSVTSVASDDYAAVMNDEGTEFTIAMETQVGQTTGFTIALNNLSGKDANFIMELKGPHGIDIAADEASDDVSPLARLSATSWLGVMLAGGADTTEDIHVVVESKDDVAPGYFVIHGRLIQVR